MKHFLYNVAHPMAESGQPIFIPFGEWKYDGTSRQRLDRKHGERIANELNARVAKGDPGIPVYQGHPDVPALAAKYPDKGALGWVTRIELVNSEEGRVKSAIGGSEKTLHSSLSTLHSKEGLALFVEWDRDPGRGFRWFSPYWMANAREGATYIVDEIASIGLVNKPNIPEFRLANEGGDDIIQRHGGTEMFKLSPRLIELAKRRDAKLANEADFDESKHPRAEDGKFTFSGGGSSGGSAKPKDGPAETREGIESMVGNIRSYLRESRSAGADYVNRYLESDRKGMREKFTASDTSSLSPAASKFFSGIESSYKKHFNSKKKWLRSEIRAMHKAAIQSGLKFNPKTRRYE